ncbi:hypothetical protein BGZ52_008917 [Haplosporangium bisporale]|nr:hypothetical protein BGZ52_008917 [Haplosporangium bisporale]
MEAYITLLTNNNYASGALVLGHSLRAAQTTKQLAILITAAVSHSIRDKLAEVYDAVIEIGEIDSHSTKNLALLGRPELGVTLTKIHVFNQTQYSKVVFLDADTLVLRNIDDLFDFAANGSLDDKDRNTRFAASPDAGWPDCFNSGVFVCRPSYEDYTGLIEMANQEGTFDGGDQGLLNSYFSGWSRGHSDNRLPFVYNTTPSSVYSYAPAFQQYRERLAVVHFVGSFKPWQWLRFADGAVFPRNTSSKDSIDLVQKWWNIYDMHIGGKPSDLHEVVHDYDLPPHSQWDRVGLDGNLQEPEVEKKPHYDGWFQAYDHQNQVQQPSIIREGDQGHHESATSITSTSITSNTSNTTIIISTISSTTAMNNIIKSLIIITRSITTKNITTIIMRTVTRNITTLAMDTMNNIIKNIITMGPGSRSSTTTRSIIRSTIMSTTMNTFIRKPATRHPDERQTHHRSGSSHSSIDREINPHHLTDYRYRLPPAIDSPDTASVPSFTAIIPEPIGLPDMYYPNAWDLPDDPRKTHPTLALTPLIIEEVTKENSSVPSGKGRPVFPWETNGSSSAKSPRTPTRTYYNFAANAEEQRRQKEAETAKRLEYEEAVLEKIRLQEHARYERDRLKEEAHEKVTGSQAFENFRLVNAWDVDLGVQMSILQKTEKRRPRSRKSSAGAIRKGYGLEDMLAYEAKQRQEQYEAELVQKRLEEEERWAKEQEEARIKEEEARLEKLRLAKLAKIRTQKRLKQQEEGSLYVFRNAWDPPNLALNKKKLRIEDDEIELALPLRQDRRSKDMIFSSGAGAFGESNKNEVHEARHAGSKSQSRIATTKAESRAEQEGKSSFSVSQVVGAGAAGTGSMALVNLERSGAAQSRASSATTTKITTPGSHRFVRTTVTTTIIRRKFKNGVEVSSESSTSSTGGETMFEIPAGERTLPYFTGGRRTVSMTNTQEASRLGSRPTMPRATTSANTQRSISQTNESSQPSEVAQTGARSRDTHISAGKESSSVRLIGSTTDTTTTTKTATKKSGHVTTTESRTSESVQSGTTFSTQGGKKLMGLALQIDTTSPVLDQDIDEAEDFLERQRRSDIREKEASAQAAAEAMEVLSKYPQATSRYARHSTSTSSSGGSSKMATTGLYAADPNLPHQAQSVSEGKNLKVKAVYSESSGDKEYLHMLDQDEDYDELEYFGEKHTHAALPLGSPYLPSTPIVPSSHRYGASASGFSSRAGSRPTTPGPSTPSRFGSSTPKGFVSKRGVELKQSAIGASSTFAEKEQTQQDTGFSNYRIEWNWKELLGKKPRHWTAEKGEEYYDPYNALSTHGSLIDSDEDDGHMLESSDEDSEEEEQLRQRSRTTSGGSAGSNGKSQTPSFSTGVDNEFTRESGFVIRGGKIARRRSSMALDRQEL